MDKAPDAFRTISEVAEAIAVPAHVLRFWEGRFPQIKPVKRAGGRRYYRPSDVALVSGIRQLLHRDGLTIREVQKMLRDHGVRHVAAIGGAKAVDLDRAAAIAMEPVLPAAPEGVAQVVPLTAPLRRPNAMFDLTVSDQNVSDRLGATVQSLFPIDPTKARDPAPIPRTPRATAGRTAALPLDQPALPLFLEPEAPHIWVEAEGAMAQVVPLSAHRPAGSTTQALAQMTARLQPVPAVPAAQSSAALRDLHRRLGALHAQMVQPPRPPR